MHAVGGDSSTEENEAVLVEEDSPLEDVDSEEEQIIVTRPEEQLDPEAEADFDLAFEKMMAESLDSRKFERKAMFDVPLPMRKAQRETTEAADEESVPVVDPQPTNTMAFSLMTKRGNRQQTRTIELPSDSNFALSMKSQQAAEREEQKRIKNLVLNYDLHDENDQHDGEDNPWFPKSTTGLFGETLEANPNTKGIRLGPDTHSHSRSGRGGGGRSAHRSRKLNLNDVDWYDKAREKRKMAQDQNQNRGLIQTSTTAPILMAAKPTRLNTWKKSG